MRFHLFHPKIAGILLILFLMDNHSNLHAGIHVWLPDTSASRNSCILIPVYVSSIGRADSVVAYDCEFLYDEQVLIFQGVFHENAMTAAWGLPFFNSNAGTGKAAAFTSNSTSMQLSDTTHVWLYLEFRIQSVQPTDTQIRMSGFHLYSLNGEIVTESLSLGTIHILVNDPPVISSIPDIQIQEDDSVAVSITSYVQDPNDSFSDLAIEFNPDPNILLFYERNGTLYVKPDPDWNGLSVIQFQATDPFGASAQGSIGVRIIPVPDPPDPFRLVSPQDNCAIENTAEMIHFEWEVATDADSGDQVRYHLYLSRDSLFQSASTLQFSNLNSSMLFLNHLIFNEGVYFWRVIAEDGQFIRESDQMFRFQIIEPGGIETDPLISHFKVCQNFPNPFNQETRIHFYLPASCRVNLDIFDSYGRHVRSLDGRIWPEGMNQVVWNSCDDNGLPAASGIYWIVLRTPGAKRVQRMCLMK